MELETCRPNSLEIKAGEQLPRVSLPAAGKRRACGWRKEAKVKPCAESSRGNQSKSAARAPGEAPAARAAASGTWTETTPSRSALQDQRPGDPGGPATL